MFANKNQPKKLWEYFFFGRVYMHKAGSGRVVKGTWALLHPCHSLAGPTDNSATKLY